MSPHGWPGNLRAMEEEQRRREGRHLDDESPISSARAPGELKSGGWRCDDDGRRVVGPLRQDWNHFVGLYVIRVLRERKEGGGVFGLPTQTEGRWLRTPPLLLELFLVPRKPGV